MRVIANNRLINRRRKLGLYTSLGGMVVLLGGLLASLNRNPQLVWVTLAALVMGFALAQYGSYNLRRWGRSPRPDQVLEESMKSFDDRYSFYAWGLPAPYVLLSPQGVYAFTTRDQTGKISSSGSKWKSPLTLGRALMLFAQEGLGNPTAEARQQAARLQEWVRGKLPEVSASVEPLIVFIDPRAVLQVTDPEVPVLDPKSIKKLLRGGGKGTILKAADFKALETLFNETAAAAK